VFDHNCFLCVPDKELVVAEGKDLVALVGLGPLTKHYYVIGTKQHSQSFADVDNPQSVLSELNQIRRTLSGDRKVLLMTENGRVPVCRSDGSEHELHCFHAHALLFDSPNILHLARNYFGQESSFENIQSAYNFARTQEPFHMVSTSETEYTVYTQSLNVPRQLFRYLVAHETDELGFEDWQSNPHYDEATERAKATRLRLEAQYG